jgi:hypothetical protein
VSNAKWYRRLGFRVAEAILFVLLIPVFIFLLLSGLALYIYDKKNDGLENGE